MPYQPGVSDRSGEIFAQGISGAGDAITQGIQAYQQNKVMAGQSVAKFEAAMRANPELFQVFQTDKAPQEAAKAFSKLQKDGAVGLRDAAVLAAFSDSYGKEKDEMQKRAYQQQQTQMAAQQAALIQQQQIAAQRQNAAQAANQRRIDQFIAYKKGGPINEVQFQEMQSLEQNPNFLQAVDNQLASGDTGKASELMAFSARQGANEIRADRAAADATKNATNADLARQKAELERDKIANQAQAAASRLTAAKDAAEARATGLQEKLDKTPGYGDVMVYETTSVGADGKPLTREAIFDGKGWKDKKTLLSLETETRDMMGNVISRAPNPILFGGARPTTNATPWRPAGTPEEEPETPAPTKPAPKTETSAAPREKGKIYRDKDGNRARWDGSKFVPL